ncbi:MAG: TIR domain-containing protein [Gammaproteobacteria bacterium]
METVFIAFNDETDSARANHVRKQLLASEQFRVAGYSPYTTWAKCKSGDSLENLRVDFDKSMESAGYTMILLGEDCATNPWIRYAIERSYVLGKPLFALDISMIEDETGKTCAPDINPLERFAVLEQNVKTYLSDRYSTYRWAPDLLDHLDNYLDKARSDARKANARKQLQQSVQSKKYRDYESMRLANPAI